MSVHLSLPVLVQVGEHLDEQPRLLCSVWHRCGSGMRTPEWSHLSLEERIASICPCYQMMRSRDHWTFRVPRHRKELFSRCSQALKQKTRYRGEYTHKAQRLPHVTARTSSPWLPRKGGAVLKKQQGNDKQSDS